MSEVFGTTDSAPRVRVMRVRVSAGPRAQSALAVGGLLMLTLSGAWMALAVAGNDWGVDTSAAPEPAWLRGPLAGLLPGLTDRSFSWLLVAMLVGYAAAIGGAGRLPERATTAVCVALVVMFGLAPVILSSDLFGYVAYAHLEVVHHLNPYLHSPSAAPHDPVLPYVYWIHARSPYGPLYTLISMPAGAAATPAGVWILKSLSTLGCLVALALIARAAPRYGRAPASAVLFVGGNPLLLTYGVGGGHNDLVVMATAAGAILLLSGERARTSAGGLLAAATALKVTGGLLAPFALAGVRPARRLLVGLLLAGAILAGLTLAVFGLDVVTQVGRIATSGNYVSAHSGPDTVGRLLGTGVNAGVRLVLAAAAGAVTLGCLWRVWRGADWLAGAAMSGLVILCATPSLVPWYIAWVLPAAALARGAAARRGTVALTAAVVCIHLPILGFAAY
jgi:alpha-1,6-mannosyltransferase